MAKHKKKVWNKTDRIDEFLIVTNLRLNLRRLVTILKQQIYWKIRALLSENGIIDNIFNSARETKKSAQILGPV